MKTIISLDEPVALYGVNQQIVACRAKIDTGARTSAIDISLANQLGYDQVYPACLTALHDLVVTPGRYDQLKLELAERVPALRQQITGLTDIQVIRAANGISIRPFINLRFTLRNQTITTQVSISDRQHMAYPMLVGKADLTSFLIDPSLPKQ